MTMRKTSTLYGAFPNTISFKPQQQTFYRWASWRSGRISDLSKVTETHKRYSEDLKAHLPIPSIQLFLLYHYPLKTEALEAAHLTVVAQTARWGTGYSIPLANSTALPWWAECPPTSPPLLGAAASGTTGWTFGLGSYNSCCRKIARALFGQSVQIPKADRTPKRKSE